MGPIKYSRREMLRSSVGLAGLTIPTCLRLQAEAAPAKTSLAKSCIVVYCWGGISHYESFDPKSNAPTDVRGEFQSTATATPGIHFCEHLPLLARHSDKLAIVRSVHHRYGGHQQGLYASLTGHDPPGGLIARGRENWPSLPAMISRFHDTSAGTPGAIRLPHAMYDNGTLMAGEYGGWLGPHFDPILIPTPAGQPFGGVSRQGPNVLQLELNIQQQRLRQRRQLLAHLEQKQGNGVVYDRLDRFRRMAADMLLDSAISDAYDLEQEDARIRGMYGPHIGGQSLLLARRLVEVGVPVVQVCAGAGDLAGGSGDNWDTHRDHFPKMKNRLLPVFDQSVSALLTDLEQRGMLGDTLVAILTDFGRTPKINNNRGRDHHPSVYSLVLAGGGIRGGQIYGSSDRSGSEPASDACTPGDFHATVYHALGINPRAELHDQLGRPYTICDGTPLPLL